MSPTNAVTCRSCQRREMHSPGRGLCKACYSREKKAGTLERFPSRRLSVRDHPPVHRRRFDRAPLVSLIKFYARAHHMDVADVCEEIGFARSSLWTDGPVMESTVDRVCAALGYHPALVYGFDYYELHVCAHGHEMDEDNTYWDTLGGFFCRTCLHANDQRRRELAQA